LHFILDSSQGFDASSSTLASGLRALIAVGFISVTREGGKVNRGQAIPTLYRFTDEACHEWVKLDIPMIRASNDWQVFATIQSATAAIISAEQNAKTANAKRTLEKEERSCVTGKKSPIQKSKRDGSKFEHAPIRNLKPGAISDFENRTVDASHERAETTVV
jgi:hypothetical protein